MDIFEMLRKELFGKMIPSDEVIEKTWVQVGKLNAEDEGRRRLLEAKTYERKREVDLYIKKVAALKAQASADSDEWWCHIHKAYGLPEGSYHLADDGRIFGEPKEKK